MMAHDARGNKQGDEKNHHRHHDRDDQVSVVFNQICICCMQIVFFDNVEIFLFKIDGG